MDKRKLIQLAGGAALMLSGVLVAHSAHATLNFCGCAHGVSGSGNFGNWGSTVYPIGGTKTFVTASGSTMYAELGNGSPYIAAYGLAFNANDAPVCDVCDKTNDGTSVGNSGCSGGTQFQAVGVDSCN
ncbi:MAG TPA: hypothetical protein VK762_14540 [Polyangiaceae bacterium]|jgi:hypothetical protein|nr:hypothetical protein [Polyangiaceae bacterium]